MPQTSSNQSDQPHVLLLGVDDYQSFDPSGRSDLQGSRNDVLFLATYCVEVLGIPVENIVALTTPRLVDDDFERHEIALGITRGDATEDEVSQHLARLLDAAKKSPVLLAFSGHGAALPSGEPVLCLGDTAKDFSRGVLPLKELGERVKQADAQDRLIALLDCCHVEPLSSARRGLRETSLPHSATTEAVANQEDLFRVSNRVLLAARPGMEAYQMRLGRVWHGALTFALLTAAERWQGENGVSHGSYRHVLKRARRTLKALGVPQHSELLVPEAKWGEIRNQPFLGVRKGRTQAKPDGAQDHVQLDPSQHDYCLYQLTQGTTVLAAMLAVKTSVTIGGTVYRGSTEYWSITGAPQTSAGCSIVNTNASTSGGSWPATPALPSGYPLSSQTGTLICATSASWGRAATPGAGWYSTSGTQRGLAWSGSTLTWYLVGDQNGPPSPSYVISATDTSVALTYQTTPPAIGSLVWYSVSYTITPSPNLT